MIFATPRLIIRKALPTDKDTEVFLRLWTDGKVMGNVGFPTGIRITRDELRQRLASQGDSEYAALLIVERRSDGCILGECKLGFPDENGLAETDIKLLPEYWGHSYGVEVKRGLLDYLFTHTNCRAVGASPNVDNIASIRMQEAVGGVRTGESVYEFPEPMRSYTTPVHCYLYEVTRQAWEALPPVLSSFSERFLIKPSKEITETEQKAVDHLMTRVFQDSPDSTLVWSPTEWKIMVYMGDILASSIDILERTITVGGLPLLVGGISGVATLPEYRGRGLATRAIQKATEFMKDSLGLKHGLLITGVKRQSFYEALGWQLIRAPAYFHQPGGDMQNSGISMCLTLGADPWPPGDVNFCGLPW